MARGATLALKITGDARDGIRALDAVEGKSSKFGQVMGGLGAGIAGGVAVGVGALAVLGKASFDAASDLEQSQGAVQSVFK
jgi:hypothetical protein